MSYVLQGHLQQTIPTKKFLLSNYEEGDEEENDNKTKRKMYV